MSFMDGPYDLNGTDLFGDIPSHQPNTAIDDNTNQDHQGYHTHHGYNVGHMPKLSTSPEILKVLFAHQPSSLNYPQGLLALVIQLLGEALQKVEFFLTKKDTCVLLFTATILRWRIKDKISS